MERLPAETLLKICRLTIHVRYGWNHEEFLAEMRRHARLCRICKTISGPMREALWTRNPDALPLLLSMPKGIGKTYASFIVDLYLGRQYQRNPLAIAAEMSEINFPKVETVILGDRTWRTNDFPLWTFMHNNMNPQKVTKLMVEFALVTLPPLAAVLTQCSKIEFVKLPFMSTNSLAGFLKDAPHIVTLKMGCLGRCMTPAVVEALRTRQDLRCLKLVLREEDRVPVGNLVQPGPPPAHWQLNGRRQPLCPSLSMLSSLSIRGDDCDMADFMPLMRDLPRLTRLEMIVENVKLAEPTLLFQKIAGHRNLKALALYVPTMMKMDLSHLDLLQPLSDLIFLELAANKRADGNPVGVYLQPHGPLTIPSVLSHFQELRRIIIETSYHSFVEAHLPIEVGKAVCPKLELMIIGPGGHSMRAHNPTRSRAEHSWPHRTDICVHTTKEMWGWDPIEDPLDPEKDTDLEAFLAEVLA